MSSFSAKGLGGEEPSGMAKLRKPLSVKGREALELQFASLQTRLKRETQKEDNAAINHAAETVRKTAAVAARLGHVTYAKKLLTEFSQQHSKKLSATAEASLCMLLGTLNFDCGDLDAAAKCFERAATLTTEVPALEALALTFREAGDYSGAADAYEKCVKSRPDSELHLTALAVTLVEKFCASAAATARAAEASSVPQTIAGESRPLLRFFEDGSDSHDTPVIPLEEKRQAARRPIELLHRALDASEDDNPTTVVALAQVMHFVEESEESLRLYERAAAARPDDLNIMNSLTALCIELGRPDRGREALEKSKSINKCCADTHVNACALNSKANLPKQAEASFRQLLQVAPRDLHAHSTAGLHLSDAGLEDAVLRIYTEFVDEHPEGAAAQFFEFAFGPRSKMQRSVARRRLPVIMLLLAAALFTWWGVTNDSVQATIGAAFSRLVRKPTVDMMPFDRPDAAEL